MKILSLFNGMSCGRIALDKLGIPVTAYFSSEIDKPAMSVSAVNYPDHIELGDINNIKYSNGCLVTHSHVRHVGNIDLLMGGSPCQDLSSLSALHSGTGLAGDKSGLFYQYYRLLKEVKPKYFLLENVSMKKIHQDAISELLGVQPILINSALVSAHTRKRLYWTNILGISQPDDRGIELQSILDSGYTEKTKSYCLTATYYNACVQNYFLKSERQHKFIEPVKKTGNTFHLYDGESITVQPSVNANLQRDALNKLKKYTSVLSPEECEKLQGVPVGFTSTAKQKDRYSMLGNGWQVDTIVHILKGLVLCQ